MVKQADRTIGQDDWDELDVIAQSIWHAHVAKSPAALGGIYQRLRQLLSRVDGVKE